MRLAGVIVIDLEEKKILTQWALLKENETINDVDWSKGEDMAFSLDDVEWIKETFKSTCVESVEVEEGLIRLYVTSKL